MAADPPTPRQDSWRLVLRILAIVVVGGLALLGLGLAAYLVVMVVAIGSYGSNK